MNEKQQRIHEGLKSLGIDLEVFYQEGIAIYHGNSPLKAHYLAHTAREIDSMIRDTFSTDTTKKALEKKLKVNKDDRKGLIASILASLGIEQETPFARKWHDVSNNFAEIAHRNSRSKEPRIAQEGMEIWDAYEDILDELVGNYYSLKRVVDNGFNFTTLTSKDQDGNLKVHDIIDRLPFLFNISAIKFYFFRNLESDIWLIPLHEKGFFSPQSIQPHFRLNDQLNIPNWIEGQYLIKVAKQNVGAGNEEITKVLNEIVTAYLLSNDEGGHAASNSIAAMYVAELICLLPENGYLLSNKLSFLEKQILRQSLLNDTIVRDYLGIMIQYGSKQLLERILISLLTPLKLASSEEDLSFLDDETFTFIESARNYQSPIREYNLYHLFTHTVAIRTLLGDPFIDRLIKITIEFYKQEPSFFDQYEIGQVDYHADVNHYSGSPFKTLVQVTFALLNADIDRSMPFAATLLDSCATILQKLFLELLTRNFSQLKDLFLAYSSLLLNNIDLIEGLKSIFNTHRDDFSAEEVAQLTGQIDKLLSGNDWYSAHFSEEEVRRFRALTILSLLKPLEPTFAEIVNPYSQKWAAELPPPALYPEDSYPNYQELVFPEFNTLSYGEVVQLLQSETNNAYQEVTLASRLLEDVQDEPYKYFTDLTPVHSLTPVFRNAILSAVRGMAYANTFTYWSELIEFIKQSIQAESFTSENQQNYQFIVEVSHLFIEKTTHDETAVNLELTAEIIQINLSLLPSLKPELVSTQGLQNKIWSIRYYTVLHSLLTASLRWGRNRLKEEPARFYPAVKETLTELLQTQDSIELHYVLGKFFRNLSYLDFDWYLQVIPELFPESEPLWYSTFSAYLTHTPYLYLDVFKRLEGEYYRAIQNPQFVENADLVYTLLEHAVMFHLHFRENEDETSLVDKIIQDGNPRIIRALVHYLLSDRFPRSILPENDGKIRSLWSAIYQQVINLEDSDDKQHILGALGNLVKHMATLDAQIFEWLATSFEQENGLNTLTFFEALLLHIEQDPESVGRLLILYSDHVNEHTNYIYGIEKLTVLVYTLYKKGYGAIADQLCDRFGRKGFNDFGHIFSENHKR